MFSLVEITPVSPGENSTHPRLKLSTNEEHRCDIPQNNTPQHCANDEELTLYSTMWEPAMIKSKCSVRIIRELPTHSMKKIKCTFFFTVIKIQYHKMKLRERASRHPNIRRWKDGTRRIRTVKWNRTVSALQISSVVHSINVTSDENEIQDSHR